MAEKRSSIASLTEWAAVWEPWKGKRVFKIFFFRCGLSEFVLDVGLSLESIILKIKGKQMKISERNNLDFNIHVRCKKLLFFLTAKWPQMKLAELCE